MNAVALSDFFLQQQARIRAISTAYIPRPSQRTPTPNRRMRPDLDSLDTHDPGAPYHGSWYGYTNKGCRCDYCKRANATHCERARLRRQYTDRTTRPSLLHASEVQ